VLDTGHVSEYLSDGHVSCVSLRADADTYDGGWWCSAFRVAADEKQSLPVGVDPYMYTPIGMSGGMRMVRPNVLPCCLHDRLLLLYRSKSIAMWYLLAKIPVPLWILGPNFCCWSP
jgi:hypothetical protein